jgi:hypothetical protein
MSTIIRLCVRRAAQQLEELSEGFRTLAYADIEPAVAAILGDLPAADAVGATRRYGLSVPRSRRECIEHVTRSILERKESWQRCESIGGSSPFIQ